MFAYPPCGLYLMLIVEFASSVVRPLALDQVAGYSLQSDLVWLAVPPFWLSYAGLVESISRRSEINVVVRAYGIIAAPHDFAIFSSRSVLSLSHYGP
jgi:hypothetical protein